MGIRNFRIPAAVLRARVGPAEIWLGGGGGGRGEVVEKIRARQIDLKKFLHGANAAQKKIIINCKKIHWHQMEVKKRKLSPIPTRHFSNGPSLSVVPVLAAYFLIIDSKMSVKTVTIKRNNWN